MTKILNFSRQDIASGAHWLPDGDTALIRIKGSKDKDFVEPKHQFFQIVDFTFDDLEEGQEDHGAVITNMQADFMAGFLRGSLERGVNIIAQCEAGLCRSGGVVEAGIALGFEDGKTHRIPNITVKNKILRQVREHHPEWLEIKNGSGGQ